MVEASRPRLIQSAPGNLAIWGGGGAGLIVALVAALMPAALFENLVDGSGLPALMPVAAPPLGATARAVLALGGGLVVAAIAWAALYLLVGPGGPLARRARVAGVPVVRRADAHPDAPPRLPLSLGELPPVVASPRVDLDVPGDLDVPLAAFDPAAVLPVPREPVRALRPLVQVTPPLAPGERLETFTLSPPPPPAPTPRTDEPPSIDSLLRRLEAGARRRGAVAH